MRPVSTLIRLLAVSLLGLSHARVLAQDLAYGALPPRSPKQFKNVLLVLFDDLRHDAPAYAGGRARTPHLDALARASGQFNLACTTTGLCSPSRAALLTGRLGHRTGLDDNVSLGTSRLQGLSLRQPTLLEWAREADYLVGYFGKWHLGPDGPIRRGAHRFSEQGFERYALEPVEPRIKDFREYRTGPDGAPEKPAYYGTVEQSYEQFQASHEARDGVGFFRAARQQNLPFFLIVSFHGPHPPYVVPRPYRNEYARSKVELPHSFAETFANKPPYQQDQLWYWHDVGHLSPDDWKRMLWHHDALVAVMDRALGEIIEALKAGGFWGNTLIVVAGDQGSMLADHKLYDKGPYAYDKLMRMPLLVRVPGLPHREIDRHVSLLDVNRTLTEWMGLGANLPNTDSRSLLPLLQTGTWNHPDEAYYQYEWYNGRWFGIRAIRTRRYKYCYNPTAVDELYDLQTDPDELTNRIDDPAYAPVRAELAQVLLGRLRATDDPLYGKFRDYLDSQQALPTGSGKR